MINKFLFYLLNLVKPYGFIEICAKDVEFSSRISSLLESFYDGKTKIQYIIISNNDLLKIYEEKFQDSNSIEYYFYDIDNCENLKNSELLKDIEVTLIHNIENSILIKRYLELFGNSKCNILDRYFKTTNSELLEKSSNLAVENIVHLVSPESDYLYENGKIIEKYYVVTGIVAETITLQETDDNIQTNNIGLKTKNSLPNEKILDNIRKNIEYCRLMNIPEIQPCEIHEGVAYLVAGAPSYKKKYIFDEILQYRNNDNHYVFVSKTSHDYMIENNVIPFGCIYLDPRDHVPSYAERAHKDVTYFVASQCDPEVIKILHRKNSKIFLYHVLVNAGEDKLFEELSIQSPPIIGGSTSMTRGIMMLNVLGFYKFKLFGLDSSYEYKPKKVHGYNQKKLPVQIIVDFTGQTGSEKENVFWTDPEMMVQCSDLEFYLKNMLNMQFMNYSEGLFKKVYDYLYPMRNKFNKKYLGKK
ncbi:MAG: 6-hydroxymethylpterin diphosphokinase MptE-like protein [Candidatus Woesearchaeota archaeon]